MGPPYPWLTVLFSLKVLEDCPGDLDYWYRHISKGAWPFSTGDHGWPISDCTAEGLKVSVGQLNALHLLIHCSLFLIFFFFQAVLSLSKIPSEIVGEPLDANRLYDAVNVILSLQVSSGHDSLNSEVDKCSNFLPPMASLKLLINALNDDFRSGTYAACIPVWLCYKVLLCIRWLQFLNKNLFKLRNNQFC